LGLTFLNGAFLVAALVALVPVVIHLISRRRVETVDFSSLRFLKELERKRIRRVRLRQILLLIVRSLILLSVALALARPTIRGPLAGAAGARARTSMAIVLDESASMGRSLEGVPLFDEAARICRGVAGLLDEGDQAFLVTASDPPRDVLPEGTFSRDALVEAVTGLGVTSSATDYAGAVAEAARLLDGARNLNRELYVIGDLQRTGWGVGGAGAAAPSTEEPPGAGGTGEPVRGYVVPVSGPTGNLGVASVEAGRKYGGTPGLFSITAEVRNRGARRVDVPVKLFVDGVQVGQAGAVLEPGGAAVATLATTVDETRWHSGWVELPPDALEIDNRRHFVIPPATRTEVLVVRAAGDEPRDDAYYVSRALDPSGTGERFSPVQIDAVSLGSQEDGRFPVAVLGDVGRLDSSGENWIVRHVEGGGGLLLVFGSRTDLRYWNADLLPRLVGTRLKTTLDRPSGARLAPVGLGHPLLDGLVFGERLIDDVTVRRGFEIETGVDGARAPEDILEIPGVGPMLVLGRTERSGEVGVILTGIDPAWSDLPQSGFLVPLIHRLVAHLEGARARGEGALVGQDLVVPLDGGAVGRVDVELPGGGTAIAELGAGGGRASIDAAETPGVYRFLVDGREAALGVVNVDPRESDLAALDPDDLGERVPGVAFRTLDASGSLEGEIVEARRGRELWRVLVYIALVLIAMEMLLARPRGA
jgi:hypothetical protein